MLSRTTLQIKDPYLFYPPQNALRQPLWAFRNEISIYFTHLRYSIVLLIRYVGVSLWTRIRTNIVFFAGMFSVLVAPFCI